MRRKPTTEEINTVIMLNLTAPGDNTLDLSEDDTCFVDTWGNAIYLPENGDGVDLREEDGYWRKMPSLEDAVMHLLKMEPYR